MKIKYVIGDMFEAPSLILMHGCNAQGVMGSGVAATIRVRVPFAYDAYRAEYERVGFLRVGDFVLASGQDTITGTERVIVNAITQEFYGRDPNVIYVSYDGVRDAVAALNYELEEREEAMPNEWEFMDHHMDDGLPTVALPLIGAGLANGDWGKIASIIEEESYAFQPVVYCRTQADLDDALKAVREYDSRTNT